MALPKDEAQRFLAEPHVAVIAVDEPGRPPLAVPIWYAYAPGGDVWLLTATDSVKGRLLAAAGTCTLTVDTVEPRVRYVSVACDLLEVRPATDADQRTMAARYVPAEGLEDYLAFVAANLPEESVHVLRPVRWRSADITPG